MFDIEIVEAHSPIARLFLAHGAGAGKEHEFMQAMGKQLAQNNIEVVLFNFPYMQTIKETGKRRPPDRMDKLLAHYSEVINTVSKEHAPLPLFIGGKSMGGRASTLLANTVASLQGVVVLGYPFHPPGKPEKTRTDHLVDEYNVPTLVVQGSRDTFGTQDEIESSYTLSDAIQFAFLPDGDHSFKPRKSSGFSQHQHIETAVLSSLRFVNAII